MATIERARGDESPLVTTVLRQLEHLGLAAQWEPGDRVLANVTTGTLHLADGALQRAIPAVAAPRAATADLTLLPHDDRTVLLTTTVSPAHAAQVHERGWGGYVDTAGNAFLRAEGLVIDIQGRRAPVARPTLSAAFTRAGLPVTFALILCNDVGASANQRKLVRLSGASIGTVNRVVRALRERTPPLLAPDGYELLDTHRLEAEWLSAYTALQPTTWPDERYSSSTWRTALDVVRATALPPGALLSSEAAAARLGAPIRPTTALFYVDDGGTGRRDLITQGRLRRDEEGTISIRPAFWRLTPSPPEKQTVPRLLLRADLLLEDDPRIDEIRRKFFDERR
ncbi:type IV toxin-antitoxin system AbiEi family antitoxin [Flexivirga caeni]|uniref:Transcriptional regulator n=1 Tax=Flexivirga caeni TaxID=2294115 RepID=A0A3M9M5P3_9MICO|nr:type IV toxin-antitoxin system AbiEi family antitoxin [Flexivirga caeni]RNI20894.1 hypothetical protein EFY87_13410 [Flexivirga caeni]